MELHEHVRHDGETRCSEVVKDMASKYGFVSVTGPHLEPGGSKHTISEVSDSKIHNLKKVWFWEPEPSTIGYLDPLGKFDGCLAGSSVSKHPQRKGLCGAGPLVS